MLGIQCIMYLIGLNIDIDSKKNETGDLARYFLLIMLVATKGLLHLVTFGDKIV